MSCERGWCIDASPEYRVGLQKSLTERGNSGAQKDAQAWDPDSRYVLYFYLFGIMERFILAGN